MFYLMSKLNEKEDKKKRRKEILFVDGKWYESLLRDLHIWEVFHSLFIMCGWIYMLKFVPLYTK